MESDLADQQTDTRGRLEALEQEDRAIAAQRENQRTLSTRIGEAKSVAERYRTEGQELRAKLELLQRTDSREAVCPLCQTPLGEDGCGRLAETYDVEIAEKRHLYRLNAAQLQQLENRAGRSRASSDQTGDCPGTVPAADGVEAKRSGAGN